MGRLHDKKLEKINEALLLNNVVDFLLGKADFEKLLRDFDPVAKEITLQSLASYLRTCGGVAARDDVIQFLITFFKSKGLEHSAVDVLGILEECGLVVRMGDDVAFKYRCFQEYFYAGLLRDDPKKLAEALDGVSFIEYFRELELLSGLRRRNSDMIAAIRTAIETRTPAKIVGQALTSFDAVATSESAIQVSRARLQKIRRKKLTRTQIDELMDAADRRLENQNKEQDDAKLAPAAVALTPGNQNQTVNTAPELDFSDFLTTLSLFGRVIRNSEFTDAAEKLPATRLCIESWVKCFLYFSGIIDELLAELDREKPDWVTPEVLTGLGYLIRKLIFVGIEQAISEQIGSDRLIPIYRDLLDDASLSASERLILSMLMLDVGSREWADRWNDILEQLNGQRFVSDILSDKLWGHVHSTPVSDQEHKILSEVATNIEVALGAQPSDKGLIYQKVQRGVLDATRK